MNYYRITICFMLFAFNSQAQDFVKFNDTDINKNIEDELVTITLPFEILEDYQLKGAAFYALYTQRRKESALVNHFIDFVCEHAAK